MLEGRDRYRDDAGVLLARGSWPGDDVDYAIRLHDLLETPEGSPDPVARRLRVRLASELRRVLAEADSPWYRLRYEFLSLPGSTTLIHCGVAFSCCFTMATPISWITRTVLRGSSTRPGCFT